MCHLEGISCGRPCGKQLPCYRHACIRSCHEGPCQSTGAQCSQSCAKPRPSCGHSCAAPCHEGDCPKTSCNERVSRGCFHIKDSVFQCHILTDQSPMCLWKLEKSGHLLRERPRVPADQDLAVGGSIVPRRRREFGGHQRLFWVGKKHQARLQRRVLSNREKPSDGFGVANRKPRHFQQSGAAQIFGHIKRLREKRPRLCQKHPRPVNDVGHEDERGTVSIVCFRS